MDKNEALFEYCLRLGDNSLIMGHRLSEWCGHGPILEEDIAMTNIALDLIGQATQYLKYAGQLEGKGRSEDDLAYHRDVMDFRNVNLVETPNGNFADTTLRQFFFDAFDYHLLEQLVESKDETLKGIAEKAIKESRYHLRHSKEWMHRLGEGTEESHQKLQAAVESYWMYTEELFDMDEVDQTLIQEGIVPDLEEVRKKWDALIREVFSETNLETPEEEFMFQGGRNGHHTEHLGYILAEMQFVPRAYPDAKEW